MTPRSSAESWSDVLSRNAVWLVAILAVAASITGVRNGFALDDIPIIVDNDRVHSLARAWELFGQTYWPPAEGASLYRPLTMLAFSLEWAVGNGSPVPFHAASILLYALVCVTLYRLLCTAVETRVALLATSLFAVHPVHTEAVANVVGQAELLVAIFLFLALERYITVRRSRQFSWRDVAVISALYAAGCLSKEHAIILPGLLVASEVLICRDDETTTVRLRRAAPVILSLIVVAILFVMARTVVSGGFRAGGMNELFRGEPFSSRAFTMLSVVVEWLRLLFWPAQLSADYSFPRTRVATEPNISMLPGIIVIIGCAVIAWRLRRSAPVVTFAILWLAVTLAIPSNLLMVTGFVLAERTLFLASAGVAILVAVVTVHSWRMASDSAASVRRGLIGVVALLLVCGLARSATRNPVWRDNGTLTKQTVEDVPISARAHWMRADYLAKSGHRRGSTEEMLLAVSLGRKDDVLLLGSAADHLSLVGMCGRAIPVYLRALAITPLNEQMRANTSLCLMSLGRIAEARAIIMAGVTKNQPSPRLDRMTALADSLASVQRERALPRITITQR